jgi:hypothetical protein
LADAAARDERLRRATSDRATSDDRRATATATATENVLLCSSFSSGKQGVRRVAPLASHRHRHRNRHRAHGDATAQSHRRPGRCVVEAQREASFSEVATVILIAVVPSFIYW